MNNSTHTIEYFDEKKLAELKKDYPSWDNLSPDQRETMLIAKYRDGKTIERLTEGGWWPDLRFGNDTNPYSSYRIKE